MDQNPQVDQATAAIKFEKVTIESDGTKDGTKVLINGKVVANMSSLYFNWYGGTYCPISLEYTVRDPESKPGTLTSYTTHRLRCPEPVGAYATRDKAEASAPRQLEFDFSHASVDQRLLDHEEEGKIKAQMANRSGYALLK